MKEEWKIVKFGLKFIRFIRHITTSSESESLNDSCIPLTHLEDLQRISFKAAMNTNLKFYLYNYSYRN